MAERATTCVRFGFVAFLQFDVHVEIVSDGFGTAWALLILALLLAFAQ